MNKKSMGKSPEGEDFRKIRTPRDQVANGSGILGQGMPWLQTGGGFLTRPKTYSSLQSQENKIIFVYIFFEIIVFTLLLINSVINK